MKAADHNPHDYLLTYIIIIILLFLLLLLLLLLLLVRLIRSFINLLAPELFF